MWERLLEVDATPRGAVSPESGFAVFRNAAAAIASERGRLLSAVRSAVNAVLESGLDPANDSGSLCCDVTAVRDLCLDAAMARVMARARARAATTLSITLSD